MINVNLLVVLYIVGMAVDWIFQWDWQATNKSKWNKGDDWLLSLNAIITHSIIYAGITSIIALLILYKDYNPYGEYIFLILFITHLIIDTRIPVKWIMRFKGLSDEQIYDYPNFGFMHIGIDHRLHEIVLLVIALIFK